MSSADLMHSRDYRSNQATSSTTAAMVAQPQGTHDCCAGTGSEMIDAL